MRLLLDENVHQGLVAWLTGLGHDVHRAPKGLTNGAVFAAAVAERRVLLTHDKDFGTRPPLLDHPGIVLLKLLPKDLEALKAALQRLFTQASSAEAVANRLWLVFSDHHDEFPFRAEEFPFRSEAG